MKIIEKKLSKLLQMHYIFLSPT